MQQIAPEPVDSIEITILADNLFDGLLVSEGPAKRPPFGPHLLNVPTPFVEDGLVFDQPVVQTASGRSSSLEGRARAPGAVRYRGDPQRSR